MPCPLVGDETFFHFLCFLNDFVRIGDGEPAIFIESDFIFLPAKERHGELGFQALHRAAQGRLRQVEFLGRCRKSAALRDGQ